LSSPLFKQEFYLKADNEQESAQNGLLSFADISRSGVQVLKRNKAFKAIELVSFHLPFSADNNGWSKNVSELINSDGFKSFVADTEVTFSIFDSRVTLVPASLYSEKEKAKNFEFLFGTSDAALIRSQKFSNSDTVGVFSVPKGIAEVASEPIQSSYLNWLDGVVTDSSKVRAILVLNEKQFALSIHKEGKLIFSNWFDYSKSEDILYYLMASLETLKILHSEVEVVLSGRVDKGDEIHSSIAKFISKLTFGTRPKNLTYSYSLKEIPEHRFPFIFSAACA
jgi:hypothetical protein